MENMYDVIIIGGGPAGVSCALYTARGGLSVCVIDGGRSALLKAESIQNFYGTGNVSGAALYKKGLLQAKEVGAKVLSTQATHCEFDGERFTVSTDGGEYKAKKLVIATGAPRKSVDIEGLKGFEGKGVSYCAVCDAFFYRKKRIAVIGAGSFAEHELGVLSAVVGEATLLTNGEAPSFAAPNVIEKKIARVFASEINAERVGGVEFDDGAKLFVDGLFVAIGVMGAADIAKSMGVFTDGGSIKVDGRGMTNVPGLYAAGDCTAGIKQVARAINDGMNVAFSVIDDVRNAR